MIINKNVLIKTFYSFTIFLSSIILLNYYNLGDQFAYRKLYQDIENVNLFQSILLAKITIGSDEPIYTTLAWIFSSNHIDKDIFIALFNSFLAYAAISIMQLPKFKVSIFIISIIIFTNFYFIILYLSAERLKFAILFLFLSILFYKSKKSILFAFISILTHSEMLAIYISIFFKEFVINVLWKSIVSHEINKRIFYLSFLLIIPIVILQEHILHKLSYFTGLFGIEETIKTFLFFTMSVIYSKNKKETILIFIPLFVMIIIVGGSRINMISYFIFLYYALQVLYVLIVWFDYVLVV